MNKFMKVRGFSLVVEQKRRQFFQNLRISCPVENEVASQYAGRRIPLKRIRKSIYWAHDSIYLASTNS